MKLESLKKTRVFEVYDKKIDRTTKDKELTQVTLFMQKKREKVGKFGNVLK